jgi:predicted AAA+ superfamily ATPase
MKRDIHDKLAASITDRNNMDVIVVEGARQVGKSYLINSILNEIKRPSLAFDLEKDRKVRKEISRTEDFHDFEALMTDRYGLKPGSILFLDEAQECSRLAEYVKSFKEDWKDIQVVLSGSSMNRFFPANVRIPVGRTKSVRLFGFSFSEFVRHIRDDHLSDFINSHPREIPSSRHQLLLELFDDYIMIGGLPEAVKAHGAGKPSAPVIEEIVASLEEDFQRKEAYRPSLFENTLRAVANHLGAPSKYTHIDDTKYHAKQIISAMKSWHILLEVTQHSHDPNRSNFLPKRRGLGTGHDNILY